MRLKSYFANSVQGAIDKARIELGPEAMLISSRQTDRDLRDVGAYEVIFGLMPTAVGGLSGAMETKTEAAAVSGNELVLLQIAELRRQMELFTQSVARSKVARPADQLAPELTTISDRLVSAGFSPELARELTDAVAQRLPRGREAREGFARDLSYAVLEEEIAGRFASKASLGEQPDGAAVMLVGPPGAGKTSSIAKLALEYGVKAKRSLHMLSLDTLRIAGCHQLAAYARISGADFRPIQDASALKQVLREIGEKGLILIDTPGYATADQFEIEELAQAVCRTAIEVQLVMPAHMTLEAAQQVFERFASLRPAKLLLTNLDAVQAPAVPIEFAMRSGLALSYFGTGQQVPEDLKEADKATLLAGITLRERTFSMAA